MRNLGVAIVALAACVTACTDTSSSPEAAPSPAATGIVNCVDAEANPAIVVTQPELGESRPDAANLVLQVTNSAPVATHLRVEVNGQLAGDSRLPAARHSECIGGPIYQWHYSLPIGQVALTATREGEPPESLTFRVMPQRRWVVIDAQQGFPLEPRLFKDKPVWG